MPTTSRSTVIEVFADISCPFAHAGLHRWFDRREQTGRSDVHLRVRAWPLEIINEAPLTGDAITAKVAALSAAFPDLFAGFDPSRFPTTTLPALQLTHTAYELGNSVGEQVASALRDRLFIHGEDISDVVVLADVARRFGVPLPAPDDHASVLDDLADGRRRGVIGSPHYFGPGFDAFCPGLDIAHVGDDLDISATGARFDEFVERCFEQAATPGGTAPAR